MSARNLNSPEELLKYFNDYKEQLPLIKVPVTHVKLGVVELPIPAPMTMEGFKCYLWDIGVGDIKRYIDGISFANTVTYDKVNNTPDIVLKNIARTIGWDLVSSILENNLLQNYITTGRNTYSGHTRGYTPLEAEYEMWKSIRVPDQIHRCAIRFNGVQRTRICR